jgi:hypothetical protein
MTRGFDHTAPLAFSHNAAAGHLLGLSESQIANAIAMAASSDASFAVIRELEARAPLPCGAPRPAARPGSLRWLPLFRVPRVQGSGGAVAAQPPEHHRGVPARAPQARLGRPDGRVSGGEALGEAHQDAARARRCAEGRREQPAQVLKEVTFALTEIRPCHKLIVLRCLPDRQDGPMLWSFLQSAPPYLYSSVRQQCDLTRALPQFRETPAGLPDRVQDKGEVTMWNSQRSLLCASMLCCALGATSADASTSRTQFFTFPCNGQQQAIQFAIGQLGSNQTRFIQAAEISLSETQPGLKFIILAAGGGSNSTLLTLGKGETHASNQFIGFFQAQADFAGNIIMSLAGECTGGGNISGFAVISVFS